jgi:hypothetical protein
MSDHAPQSAPDRKDESVAEATSSVFAAAAVVVASAEAVVMKEQDDAADIEAAAAWAAAPSETTSVFEADRVAWLEAAHAGERATENDPLARMSIMAATVAAEALASGLSEEELATSDDMTAGIAAILAARAVPGYPGASAT